MLDAANRFNVRIPVNYRERITRMQGSTRAKPILFAFTFLSASIIIPPQFVPAQSLAEQPKRFAWSDASLSADERADLVIKEMTLDEKISLLHGHGVPYFSKEPTESNGGAGYTTAIPRLGIPAIQMADSAYGVTRGAAAGRYSTVLPSNLAAASRSPFSN